jgi:hypothetical protein
VISQIWLQRTSPPEPLTGVVLVELAKQVMVLAKQKARVTALLIKPLSCPSTTAALC